MEVRVLGPIEVVGDDGPIRLGASMQRRLLAALTSRLGETCWNDALVEALWSTAPPRSAGKLLQVYTSQLRKVLPAGARIDTRGGGYALELERDSVDATRFESLLARGHGALQDGNAALADSVLR